MYDEPRRLPRPDRGLTLVEMLVALGVAGLLTVALLAYAQVHTGLERREQQSQLMLDNTRGAMEELTNSLRHAGSPVLAPTVVNAVPGGPNLLPMVQVINNSQGAAGGNGPDELQVLLGADQATATLITPALPTTNPLVADTDGGLHANDYIVLTDFNSAILYRLNGDPWYQTLEDGTTVANLQIVPPTGPAPPYFAPYSMIVRVQLLDYHIDTTIFHGDPVLVLQDGAPLYPTPPQIVAENIEDMQVAVGVDGLHNGIPDGNLQEVGAAADDDEWVYNYPGETLPSPLPPGSRITAIRVTLVARSTQADGPLGPGRPAVEDRPAGPPDNYRRRVLTTLVTLRSMVTN